MRAWSGLSRPLVECDCARADGRVAALARGVARIAIGSQRTRSAAPTDPDRAADVP